MQTTQPSAVLTTEARTRRHLRAKPNSVLTHPDWDVETAIPGVTIGFVKEWNQYVPTLVCQVSNGTGGNNRIQRSITREGMSYAEAWEKIIEHIEFHTDRHATVAERRARPSFAQWEQLVIEMQESGEPISDAATLPLYDAHR